MASISSSFHCISSSSRSPTPNSILSSAFAPKTAVRFQSKKNIRPISAVCAAATPVSDASASWYSLLGIQSAASCQEIKAAYRRLVRVLHPDVAAQKDVAFAADFIRVHEAYATLSDPGKRADYDRGLLLRRRSMNSGFVKNGSGKVRGPTMSRFRLPTLIAIRRKISMF